MGFMPCMKVPMLKPEKLLRNQLFTHFIIYYIIHSIKAKEHIVKRVIYLLILMSDLIYAATATAEYDIDFSVAGTVAKASMQKVQEGDAYTITLQAHAVGIAAKMTQNRSETYISQGSVVNSEFIPDVLVVIKKSDNNENYTVYRFDHKNKVVEKDRATLRQVSSQSLDVANMRIVRTQKIEFSHSSVKHDYYAKNDIVTLFFNSSYYIGSMDAGERKNLRAVGIKTEKGKLMISLPTQGAVIENMEDVDARQKNLFGVALNREIFEKGKGELLVKLDADGFPFRAVMNDVALYGDVVGKRRYTSLASNF